METESPIPEPLGHGLRCRRHVVTRLPPKRILMQDETAETRTVDLRVVETWKTAEDTCVALPRELREIIDLMHLKTATKVTVFSVYVQRTVRRALRQSADLYSNLLTLVIALEVFQKTADEETKPKIAKILKLITPPPKRNAVGALDLVCKCYDDFIFVRGSKYAMAVARAFEDDLVDFWHLFSALVYERFVPSPEHREQAQHVLRIAETLAVEWEDMCRV